MEQLNIVVPI